MPFPNQRMRLCHTCFTPYHSSSISSPFSRTTNETFSWTLQRRILTNTVPRQKTEGPALRSPVQRSPHQWSHIVHHVRKPAVSRAQATGSRFNMVQARGHMGHSHGHHHHHDNTFLTSSNKNDPGVKITRVGLYVNLGMAIAKGAGGYVFNSQA